MLSAVGNTPKQFIAHIIGTQFVTSVMPHHTSQDSFVENHYHVRELIAFATYNCLIHH